MNTPNRPHDALDAEERELARVVHALPVSEASAALDLRILKAAQDAIAAAPARRMRRGLWATSSAGSLWGIGTAAAAVFAVGLSWQMFMRAPSANFPDAKPAIAVAKDQQEHDATPVDFVGTRAKVDQLASAPAADKVLAQAPRVMPIKEPMRQENSPSAAGPQPFLDEHVAGVTEAQTAASDLRDAAMAQKSAVAENAANAPAPAAVAMSPAPEQSGAIALERREQAAPATSAMAESSADAGLLAGAGTVAASPSGEVISESKENARQRVHLDVRLYPESWLAKIQLRLKHGDISGARASLELFVVQYPHDDLPENLKPLLKQ